jgi:hypothetical protein
LGGSGPVGRADLGVSYAIDATILMRVTAGDFCGTVAMKFAQDKHGKNRTAEKERAVYQAPNRKCRPSESD